MKIIEGSLAGTIINYKEQKRTRVTTDKVRKAVFDVLKGLVDFEGIKAADLFCGSGMYGLESLSRGAKSVLFLDEDRIVVKSLENNLSQLKVESCKVIRLKFEKFIKTYNEKFDVVFADPPYYNFDFSNFNDIYKILNKNGICILEISKRVKVGGLEKLVLLSKKIYGDTVVLFYQKN